jgi:leader peptidase (prepilin peptidase) / N-methyltransferase
MPAALLPAAVLGLIIGSFLNVVAFRVPARISIAAPGSRCPGCEMPIKPYDNIPVLSWMLLRGRCRGCKTPIAARYPLVEALTAVLFAAVAAVHHADAASLVLGLQLIPNRLTLPAAAVGIVLGTTLDPAGEVERLIAGLAGGLLLMLPSLLHPSGMGMGDAKLVGVLGLYLGAAVAPAFFVALVIGTIGGVAIMMRKGIAAGRKTRVPFGPFLAARRRGRRARRRRTRAALRQHVLALGG